MAIPLIKQLREDMGVGTIGIPAACDCVRVSPNTLATMDNAIMNLELLGGDTGTLQPIFDDLRSGKYQVTNNDCCMDIADTTVAALEAELAANTVDYPVPFFPSHWEPLPTSETGGDTILIGRYDTELYGRNDCTFKINTSSSTAFTVEWGDGVTETYTGGDIVSRELPDGVHTVKITGILRGYYANFRHGDDNLYATGLHEQHYYGVGWTETYHQHSDVKYYFEHDEIHQNNVGSQFSYIDDIFINKTFVNATSADEFAKYTGRIICKNAIFNNITSAVRFAESCKYVYLPSATFEIAEDIHSLTYRASVFYAPVAIFTKALDARNSFMWCESINLGSFSFASLGNGTFLFYGCSGMTHSQCVEVLNSLPDVTAVDPDPQIDLSSTAGESQLTAAEIAVGTDKGWEVLT